MPLTKYITDNTISFPNVIVLDYDYIDAIIDGQYEYIEKIIIPEKLSEFVFGIFYGLPNLTEIKVNPNNKVFSSKDGVLFDKKQEKLLCYPCKKQGVSYTLPDTVKEIISWPLEGLDYDDKCVSRTGYGFRNNIFLKQIILNANLKNITIQKIEYALEGCNQITLI